MRFVFVGLDAEAFNTLDLLARGVHRSILSLSIANVLIDKTRKGRHAGQQSPPGEWSKAMTRNQTASQVAAEIGISDEAVRRAVRAGAPADRLGRRTIRVNAGEIRAWFAEREAERAGKGPQ